MFATTTQTDSFAWQRICERTLGVTVLDATDDSSAFDNVSEGDLLLLAGILHAVPATPDVTRLLGLVRLSVRKAHRA